MKTDIIEVYSDTKGSDLAMQEAEKFAEYYRLSHKDSMHLRLLTEEMISLVHGILDKFTGRLWLESQKKGNDLHCRICLSVEKEINREQEDSFLSVSTNGKNENARGITGKIRELIRRSLQSSSREDALYLANVNDSMPGIASGSTAFSSYESEYWSLKVYRSQLASKKEEREEGDELEKSIIAKLADEVRVWLKDEMTEIVIEKTFRQ